MLFGMSEGKILSSFAVVPGVGSPLAIITPVFEPEVAHFRSCVRSVLAQCDPAWRWYISVSGHVSEGIGAELAELSEDPRVKILYECRPLGISDNTNRALELVTEEFFALLDQDDLLTPDAVSEIRQELEHSDPDIAYSDEAKISDKGDIYDMFFKPDWSPVRFSSQMYVGHCLTLRTALVRECGPFDSEFDGSQDYELVLRLIQRAKRIAHIEKVLYLWRVHEGSTASGHAAKPQADVAAVKALSRHLGSGKYDVSTFVLQPGVYRHYFHGVARPPISIVIPSGGLPSRHDPERIPLREAIEAIHGGTDYPGEVEILIVVDTAAGEREACAAINDITGRCRPSGGPRHWRVLDAIRGSGETFNFSRSVNYGALQAEHDLLLLLNDDVLPIESDWLNCLVETHEVWDAGAVGPLLLEPTGSISQAGISVSGTPINIARGHDSSQRLPFSTDLLGREVSAITGAALMVSKDIYVAVGGFDESFPSSFNDVDFCLKLGVQGHSCIVDPRSPVVHAESSSRDPSVSADEIREFLSRWSYKLNRDPFYPTSLVIWDSEQNDWSAGFDVRREALTYEFHRTQVSTPLIWIEGYLDSNPDLRSLTGSPEEMLARLERHIVEHGRIEKRRALVATARTWPFERDSVSIESDFDTDRYLLDNPDVANAVGEGAIVSAWHHWETMGRAEGRTAPKSPVKWIQTLLANQRTENPPVGC